MVLFLYLKEAFGKLTSHNIYREWLTNISSYYIKYNNCTYHKTVVMATKILGQRYARSIHYQCLIGLWKFYTDLVLFTQIIIVTAEVLVKNTKCYLISWD